MNPKPKRQIPYPVHQAFTKFKVADKGRFKEVAVEDVLYFIPDPNPDSDFYFKIIDVYFDQTHNKVYYEFEKHPSNPNVLVPVRSQVGEDLILSTFRKWCEHVDLFEEVDELYSEYSIRDQYKTEYVKFNELKDDDKDTHSYSYDDQVKIDRLLGECLAYLDAEENKEAITEEYQKQIDLTKVEVKELKEKQTRLVKSDVHSRLASIWAWFRYMGIGATNMLKKTLDVWHGYVMLDNPESQEEGE